MPIDEEEIAFYRTNITDKYVIEIQTLLDVEERKNLKNYEMRLRFKKLTANKDYKRCKWCGEYKRLTEFYKNPLKKQGVFDYCKECAKFKNKQRREYVKIDRERKRSVKNALSA